MRKARRGRGPLWLEGKLGLSALVGVERAEERACRAHDSFGLDGATIVCSRS